MIKIFLLFFLLSISLFSSSLLDVTKKISEYTGKTFVFSKDVNSSVNIFTPDLSKVKNILILKDLLRDNGYSLVLKNNYYKIIDGSKIYNYSVTVDNDIKDEFIKYFKYDGIKYTYIQGVNVIYYKCSYSQNLRVKKMLKKVDKKNISVMLRFIIFSYNTQDILDMGIDYTKISFGNIIQSLTASTFNSSSVLSSDDFFSALKFLQQKGVTEIKQFPYIVVRNNKKFNFKNVTSVPIQINTISTDSSVNTNTVSYEYKDVGLNINGLLSSFDGYVSLDMKFIIDSIIGGADTRLPILGKKSFNSFVDVPYGKVLLVSGLKDEKTTLNDYSIPYLSGIPFLGSIFSYKSKSKETNNFGIAIQVEKF